MLDFLQDIQCYYGVGVPQRPKELPSNFEVKYFDQNTLDIPNIGKSDFDVVFSFDGLSRAFAEEKLFSKFLFNVNNVLKKDGFFVSIVLDSAELWQLSQKDPKCGINLGTVETEKDAFGKLVSIKLDKEMEEHYVVHFKTLIDVARRLNLEVHEIQNLRTFYDYFKGWSAQPKPPSTVGFLAVVVFRKV